MTTTHPPIIVNDNKYHGRSHHKTDPPRFGAALKARQQEVSRRAVEEAMRPPLIKKPAGGYSKSIVDKNGTLRVTTPPHVLFTSADNAAMTEHLSDLIDPVTGEAKPPWQDLGHVQPAQPIAHVSREQAQKTFDQAKKFARNSKVEILPGVHQGHGGPHRYVDGVCSCGAREVYKDEVEIGHDEPSPTDHVLTQEDYEVFPKIEQWEEALAAAKKSKKGIKHEAKKRGWKLTNPGDGKSREDWSRPDDEVAS